jgi:hypothetical protein
VNGQMDMDFDAEAAANQPLSWDEAKNLLETYRGYLLARARYEAVQIALRDSDVHIRQVRTVMSRAGLLHRDLDERWMGAVFPGGLFEPTGEWALAGDASPRTRPGGGGSGMPRRIRLWRIKSGVTLPSSPESVEKPPSLPERRTLAVPPPETLRAGLDEMRKLHTMAVAGGYAPHESYVAVLQWAASQEGGNDA